MRLGKVFAFAFYSTVCMPGNLLMWCRKTPTSALSLLLLPQIKQSVQSELLGSEQQWSVSNGEEGCELGGGQGSYLALPRQW